MAVHLTQYLTNQLLAVGIRPADFQRWFELWKAARTEDDSYFFGRDTAYVIPEVHGEKYRLRHAHLVPLLDSAANKAWCEAYAEGRNRSSNRILVYVQARNKDYLAIAILNEPDAHAVQRMETQADEETMYGFALAAEEFLTDGSIIV